MSEVNGFSQASVHAAPLPRNEAKRLAALRQYHLLDTAADPVYDAFARLAAEICDTPIGLVSLIDESRQWFKANVGLDGVSETPREIAFCAHALLESDILEIPDATLDERFAANPLVTGDRNVRFYAGMPLVDRHGHALGTLCVIDTHPKTLSLTQRDALRLLGETVAGLIESRHGVSPASLDRVASLGGILANAAVPIAISQVSPHDRVRRFVFVNRAFTELFGFELTDIAGKTSSALHGVDTDLVKAARLEEDIDRGSDGSETLRLSTANGAVRLVEIRDREIAPTYRIVSYRDLTNVHAAQEALGTSNRRLQSLLDNNRDAVIVMSVDGSWRDVNAAAETLFGYGRERLLGSAPNLVAGADFFPGGEAFPEDLILGRNVVFMREVRRADGGRVTVDWKAVPMIVRGTVEGAFLIGRDVTEERRLIAALETNAKRSHALHRIAASRASDAVQIGAALALALETFGMDFAYVGERIGETIHIRNAVGDEAVPTGAAIPLEATYVSETLATGDVYVIDDLSDPAIQLPGRRTYDGWHAYISAPIETDAGPYGAIGFLSHHFVAFDEHDRDFVRLIAGVISSAIERMRVRERLDRLAYWDALTGIPNRASFARELEKTIARCARDGSSFALYFIDLDGFKHLNDEHGHAVGDLALIEAGERITRTLERHDFAARLGGDEFVVISDGLDAPATDVVERAGILGRRLVTSLAEAYLLDDVDARLSASVGIAVFPRAGGDAKAMMRAADTQLYRAKSEGKNRYAI